jgi:hypothetical protein
MGIPEIIAGQEGFSQDGDGFILGGNEDINGASGNGRRRSPFHGLPDRKIKKKRRDSTKDFCTEKHPGKKERIGVKGLCISPVEIKYRDQQSNHSDGPSYVLNFTVCKIHFARLPCSFRKRNTL